MEELPEDDDDPRWPVIHAFGEAKELCLRLYRLSFLMSILKGSMRIKFYDYCEEATNRLLEITLQFWPDEPQLLKIIEQVKKDFKVFSLLESELTQSSENTSRCPICNSALFDTGLKWCAGYEFIDSEIFEQITNRWPTDHYCKKCCRNFGDSIEILMSSEGFDCEYD